MKAEIEEEKESEAMKTEPEQQEEENREEEPAAAVARSLPPSYSLFRCIIGPSTVIFPRRLPTAEGNIIYRGQHHKQQHSLTNTQWQPRPHADTLPHYKSREVAGWEREREGERRRERESGRGMDRVRQIERDVEADRR